VCRRQPSVRRLQLCWVVLIALLSVVLAQTTRTPAATAQASSFGEGLVFVGSDILPGRYIATEIDGCFWERLSGLGGTNAEVNGNDFIGAGAQVIVDIEATDLAFDSNDCGSWTRINNVTFLPVSAPVDGIWLVGDQVRPGTYQTVNSVTACYWERMESFSSESQDRIANDLVSSGRPTVQILPSDVGFNSSRCGQWTRVALPGTCDGLTPTVNLATGVGAPTNGDDVILGTSGNDVIDALGGNDVVCAGGGDDVVTGGDGSDLLLGGDGRDVLRGGPGFDSIDGGNGDDRLLGGIGADSISGGDGNDFIGGFGGDDSIDGGAGNETIFGGFGADTIVGGLGDDNIRGLVGDDVIIGGAGNDELYGDRGNDVINGGTGNDLILGGNASDMLSGDAGNDELRGGKADDQLSGGTGTDVCIGNTHFSGDTAGSDCESRFGIP